MPSTLASGDCHGMEEVDKASVFASVSIGGKPAKAMLDFDSTSA
jgi:hypothetical protein